MLRKIVQLAAAHGVPVVAPREDFGVEPFVQRRGEFRLGFLEAIERNAHIHVVRAVLENVVDQAIERAHELDVHGGGRVPGIGGPLVAPFIPGNPRDGCAAHRSRTP